MTDKVKAAHRLALLEGADFSPADLEAIVNESRILSESSPNWKSSLKTLRGFRCKCNPQAKRFDHGSQRYS